MTPPDEKTLREALQRMHHLAIGKSDRAYMSIPADPKRDADLLLSAALDELIQLRKFKVYVHERLDAMGVPANPAPPKHALEGCRIGDRLDVIETTIRELTEGAAVLSRETEETVAFLGGQIQSMEGELDAKHAKLVEVADQMRSLQAKVTNPWRVVQCVGGAGADQYNVVRNFTAPFEHHGRGGYTKEEAGEIAGRLNGGVIDSTIDGEPR